MALLTCRIVLRTARRSRRVQTPVLLVARQCGMISKVTSKLALSTVSMHITSSPHVIAASYTHCQIYRTECVCRRRTRIRSIHSYSIQIGIATHLPEHFFSVVRLARCTLLDLDAPASVPPPAM